MHTVELPDGRCFDIDAPTVIRDKNGWEFTPNDVAYGVLVAGACFGCFFNAEISALCIVLAVVYSFLGGDMGKPATDV